VSFFFRLSATNVGRLTDEKAQSLVIFAAGLVLLVGIVGLSVDIGRLMQREAALQRAADAAALAGSQDLAAVVPDTDAAIESATEYLAINEGGERDDDELMDSSIEFSSVSRDDDTISVEVEEPVEFWFLRFLGVSSGTASGEAKVMVEAATGFTADEIDVFPYTVWGGARTAGHTNSCPYNICLGSTQVYRSNHWDSDSYVTGSGWAVNGNNFKGYFHAGGDIIEVDPTTWQTFSKGGNAMGQEPLDALDAHIASGEPIILPVISEAQCTGGCGEIKFKIVACVALKITSRGNASQAWTGTVVNWSSPKGYSGGPSAPPVSFASVWTRGLID
jgi:hypothetical protein